jgi:class 3 adenylate cyclase
MIIHRITEDWFRHRLGEQHTSTLPEYITEALELGRQGIDLTSTFGNRRIKSFVGFVDLEGFSLHVEGQPPESILKYLDPFLKGVTNVVVRRYGFVDKTIGDEVMFGVPDFGEERGVPSTLLMGQVLGGLHDLAIELGPEYRYRIGVSYGKVLVARIAGDGYSEWTLVGEPVHVAKRLLSLPCVQHPQPVAGVVGLKVEDDPEAAKQGTDRILGCIAGFASRWESQPSELTRDLKGVGTVAYGCFLPRLGCGLLATGLE